MRGFLPALAAGLAGVVLPSAAADLSALKARGTLRVLVASDEQAEMFALTPGGPPGFDREVLEGFARLNRIRVEPVVVPFEESIPALLKERGDVIIGLVDTEARRAQIDFTAEVLPTRTVVVTRKPVPPIVTLGALRASRVGVVAGTSWLDAGVAAGVPASRLVSYPDLGSVLAALRTGKAGATITSLVDATLAIRDDPELQAGIYLGVPGQACYGVRKAEPELKGALDDYLVGLRRSGTWSRLVVKYFGDRALTVLGRARE
jgi:L-cystine transport system substrate-binding protein